MRAVPRINTVYWLALFVAGACGANLGDTLSHSLGFGNLAGLPVLAALLLLVILGEAALGSGSALFYWAAVIVLRAAATNVGDSFRDHGILFAASIPLAYLGLCGVFAAWRLAARPGSANTAMRLDGVYWTTMLLAAVLGTQLGDCLSYRVHLGNLGTLVACGSAVLVALSVGHLGLLTRAAYYWTVAVLVFASSIAGGDLLAWQVLGLPHSTLATAIASAAVILAFYGLGRRSGLPHRL